MLKIKQMVSGVITGMDEAHNGLLRIGKDIVLVRHVLSRRRSVSELSGVLQRGISVRL